MQWATDSDGCTTRCVWRAWSSRSNPVVGRDRDDMRERAALLRPGTGHAVQHEVRGHGVEHADVRGKWGEDAAGMRGRGDATVGERCGGYMQRVRVEVEQRHHWVRGRVGGAAEVPAGSELISRHACSPARCLVMAFPAITDRNGADYSDSVDSCAARCVGLGAHHPSSATSRWGGRVLVPHHSTPAGPAAVDRRLMVCATRPKGTEANAASAWKSSETCEIRGVKLACWLAASTTSHAR